MEKRTAEIIMICKGRHDFGKDLTHKQAIAAYLSDRCGSPVEEYTEEIVDYEIYQAVLDYLDGADKPSCFIRQIMDVLNLHNNPMARCEHIDYYDAVCIAFSLVQVRHRVDGCMVCVNGFSEPLLQIVQKNS